VTSDANAFLAVLGKDDDEDDVPRRRKKKTPAPEPEAAPAPVEDAAPITASQARAKERRTRVEDVALPVVPKRRPMPEPVHKTSVDLLLTLKQGLADLCDRDHTGPKLELNEALRAHLEAKGIHVQTWEG
jgi:hypothetical protein